MKHKLFYKHISDSAEETKKIAESFAEEILRHKPQKSAVVLALSGNLGAGKTTFLQGFAKGLGIKEKITSPTFVILKKFKIPNPLDARGRTPRRVAFQTNPKSKILNSKFSFFYHIDYYRLNNSKEVLDLGFREIVSNPENIIAVEWPEKIHKILPKNVVKIKFTHPGENKRKISVSELK